MTSVSHDNFSTADPYVGRSAPWSQEAEQAVLAAMLLDQDAALRAAETVDDTMFYREGHRRLYRAMLGVRRSLGELRGKVHTYNGIPLVVTYHPAALLRNPNWKKPTWDDVRIARQLLDR